MNKLLILTVLVSLLALNVESFRVVRQAEEETGSLSKISNTLKSYYSRAIDTVNGYVEDIKALKLEEQAKNMYADTSNVLRTYAGIMQDQLYHLYYNTQ